MKKILFLLLAVLSLAGCSKDDDLFVITNRSGITWYDTQIWFRDSEEGDMNSYKEVGTVNIGSSCAVEPDGAYFYIYAEDARGEMIMSKNIKVNGSSATVREGDLY